LSLVFTNDLNGITTFIASVLIIGVTPAIAAITIIYATSYCIILARRQFRRLAFFNYQVSDSANNIEALQDFSNEASVFMLKLHNENKEMKKQIRKVTKLHGMNAVKNMKEEKDVSNESKVIMLKQHNENKEMKKKIREVTKLHGMNDVKNVKRIE